MKKLFLLFIILLASCNHGEKGGRAAMLEFSADWQGAFKTAHDEGRQIFIMFSTEWCPQCEYVKERIFIDPNVAEGMKRFVRGFELATEVARSKLALLWAEAHAAKGEYAEAASVIKGAMDDLAKSGTSGSGRAARMMKELKQALAEYEDFSGAVK